MNIQAPRSPTAGWLADGGELSRLIAAMDWSPTPLGSIESWPHSLRTTISLALASDLPINTIWGPQRVQIYNDAYLPICGARHPRSLGQDFKECWLAEWPAIGAAFEHASRGHAASLASQRMFLDRAGVLEEAFFTLSFSPIRDEAGHLAGLFHPVTEVTQQALVARRLQLVRDLADHTAVAKSMKAACAQIAETLAAHPLDLPFAALYLLDADGEEATIAASTGLSADLAPRAGWPLAEAARHHRVVEVHDLLRRFGPLGCGPYPEPPQTALLLPIRAAGFEHPRAVLVAGVSPRRPLDQPYRTFYLMLADAIQSALAGAQVGGDSAARRQAEEALQRSEHRYRTVVEATSAITWSSPPSGLHVEAQPAWMAFTGQSADEMLGAGWTRVVHPDDLAGAAKKWSDAVASGAPFSNEHRIRRHDGEWRWMSVHIAPVHDPRGHVVEWFGMGIDITARKAAEEELRLRAGLLNAVGQAALATDMQGRIIYWNAAAERLYGWSRAEAVGRMVVDVTCPGTSRAQAEELMVQLNLGQSWSGEFTVKDRSGRVFLAEVTDAPVLDDQGRLVAVVGISVDITGRKRIEQALQEADRQKDEFLAMLAHELRNPLAPLRSGLHVLKLAGGDARVVEEHRAMMERQIEQMARLLDDLMDVSRISRGKITLRTARMALGDAVRDALDQSRPLIEAGGHELVLDVPPEPIYVDGDRARLGQVFANLLNNAAKYTPRGGRVRLGVARRADCVEVSVEDTGVGIPAPMLTRVFEIFTQLDRSLEKAQGGLGIGLSIARRLVEMHGGSIQADSDGPGRGSRFTVRLPLAPVDVAGDPAQAAQAAELTGVRVLVVDDNEDAAVSLALMLDLMGNETHTAYDGEEAVAAAEAFRPDVILMDIGMPRLNGYDACRRIREQPWGRSIRMVALTGWGQDEDRRCSQEAGFDGHLVKPVDPAALTRLLTSPQAARVSPV